MYKIVFDADGLLKVHKAGFLEAVTTTYLCLLPSEVHREAMLAARHAHPEETSALENLRRAGRLLKRPAARSSGADRLLAMSAALGTGERGALRLFYKERADFLVTDDRAFLALLTRNRISFLTPSEMLFGLRKANLLSREEAEEAAERLRPLIRREVYRDLKERLEGLS
jgi:hypothetical protein